MNGIHTGHRQRLRERFRAQGLGGFAEHEVLELLLTYAIPQKDVNPLAHDAVVFKAQKPLAAHGRDGRAAVFLAVLPGAGGQHAVVLAAEQDPVAVLGDADRENVIFVFVDMVQHRLG